MQRRIVATWPISLGQGLIAWRQAVEKGVLSTEWSARDTIGNPRSWEPFAIREEDQENLDGTVLHIFFFLLLGKAFNQA